MSRKQPTRRKARNSHTAEANKEGSSDWATERAPISVRRDNDRIWSHLRKKWLVETPEERVRQQFLPVLVDEYGFGLGQMKEEESVTDPTSAPPICFPPR